tara:strand:- start:6646 stop:6873 length:228 start_codon:yes stop_codon:yes gene_type:complete
VHIPISPLSHHFGRDSGSRTHNLLILNQTPLPIGLYPEVLVQMARIELALLSKPEPKSGVSTYFTTSAFGTGNGT